MKVLRKLDLPYVYLDAYEDNRRVLYARLIEDIANKAGYEIANDDYIETGRWLLIN